MKRRNFIKNSAGLATIAFLPSCAAQKAILKKTRIRTAHIGVGGMGMEDLMAISSHPAVDVTALCDVNNDALQKAKELFPKAKIFKDYRIMLRKHKNEIDAVVVSTPDHTHAPASMMAMGMNKHVYCQKPLTHHVTEARDMANLAADNNLTTQMGIQVHSFYDYRLATELIQSGIIGKVSTVRAWSPKNWGYDGPPPLQSEVAPDNLDWNLWLGTAPKRDYHSRLVQDGKWRQIMDYGCGTLGDMGVHIFDTPYNALQLDVPMTVKNTCRQPNDFGFPEVNQVIYEFPGTLYTTDTLTWAWYDGPGAPNMHTDFFLPNGDRLPDQGAMFVGEKGNLLLPHFMQEPKLIVDRKYVNIDKEIMAIEKLKNLGPATRDYGLDSPKHYHQFIDACLGNDTCTAPFDYSARLTEVILLGVIAGRFPNQTLHWDRDQATFAEAEANQFLGGEYREF